MNRLSTERRAQVVGCLVEGMSIRAVERITGVAKHTILKLLIDLGQACSEFQDYELRNLDCKIIEADEIWGFVSSKQKNVPDGKEDDPNYGDVWTWTAIDAETKLIPSWLVGERSVADCYTFFNANRRVLPGIDRGAGSGGLLDRGTGRQAPELRGAT